MDKRIAQIQEMLRNHNPEIYSETSPSKAFLIMEDKYGTRVLVFPYGGRILICGVETAHRGFRVWFDNIHSFLGDEGHKIYKQIPIFDNGRRISPDKEARTFMQKFVDNGRRIFLDSEEDPECYKKIIDKEAKYLFNRWDLTKSPKDRAMQEAMFKGDVRIGGIPFSGNKHDMLKAWYYISFRLMQEFDLTEELSCIYSSFNKDIGEEMKDLKKLWKLEL